MPIFVIAGKADCPQFVHAIQVATYLSDHLPDIVINKHEFHGAEWNSFLLEINDANNWYITASPVIWKEVAFAGSKPHLIGGLSEFFEYIDDYYGTKTFLDSNSIEEICSQNFNAYKEKNLSSKDKSRSSVVGIYGFNNDLAQLLLQELFSVPNLFGDNLATIKVYDKEALEELETEEEIRAILESFETDIQAQVKFELVFCTKLSSLVENTDYLLITKDYTQKDYEERRSWLERCSEDMQELAEEINDYDEVKSKIICCHSGPVCYTASTITKYIAQNLRKYVVAVTADRGLRALNSVSKLIEIPVSNLSAPPVWGFVGLDEFIDVHGIIVLQDIIRPYKRAIKDIRGSSLPQKKIRKELRILSCMVNQKDFESSMINRCNAYCQLGKTPILALLRATTHLLELWCSKKNTGDIVISLGVYCDGTSGIPADIVFSRPVCLLGGLWEPFDELPVLDQSEDRLKKCKSFTFDLMEMIRSYM